MGGTCSTNKAENIGPVGEEEPNVIVASSEWDESESDNTADPTDDPVDRSRSTSDQGHLKIDDTSVGSALGEEKSQTPNSDVKEDKDEMHTVEDNPENDDEESEDPIKAAYSETEFLSKKRQAFTLDMDLYKELTR